MIDIAIIDNTIIVRVPGIWCAGAGCTAVLGSPSRAGEQA